RRLEIAAMRIFQNEFYFEIVTQRYGIAADFNDKSGILLRNGQVHYKTKKDSAQINLHVNLIFFLQTIQCSISSKKRFSIVPSQVFGFRVATCKLQYSCSELLVS